ncbi:MAG: hypothetical protein KIS94_02380 [Chitinophagales bacterium]|nr:hypothetical protein [Chitinophagales bacterium]
MKTILITCLLGVAMLFSETATAEKAKSAHRIVDVTKEGIILYVASQPEDGLITKVQIFDSSNELVFEKTYASYSVEVDLMEFRNGSYMAKVFTQYAPVYSEYFSI